jgi:RNA polymerase sigma factor (sigma-70 family)
MEDREGEILWRRFGLGDREAFADLYRRHEQDVLRFCRAVVRDEDDAREAANSTWASIWAARHAATRDIPLRPWLFRIARNEAVDVLRRRRPHEHEPLDADLAALDDPEADAQLHERLATLRADLLSLPERQRSALVLREMSGLSHTEIAAVLGTSTGVAKQTIYEARQALADAETGRSLDHAVVRRAITAGDQRVMRGRRIRAHLRGCAACREFAAEHASSRLGIVAPVGLLALVSRLREGGEVTAGGVSASLPALAANLGGSVAAKLAVSAAVIAVGAGGERLATRAAAEPVGGRAATTATTTYLGTATRAVSAQVDAGDLGRGARPPASGDVRSRHGGTIATTTTAPAAAARPVDHGAVPQRPAPDTAASGATAAQAETTDAPAEPPGQAQKAEAKPEPPGQAKTTDSPPEPPGQAKKADAKPEPPGQAKKDPVPPDAPPGAAAPSPTPVSTVNAALPAPPRPTDLINNGNGPGGNGPPGREKPKP